MHKVHECRSPTEFNDLNGHETIHAMPTKILLFNIKLIVQFAKCTIN
jgi:hypothetical protein